MDNIQLDDPLSALDAGTSKIVFDKLVRGTNAVFVDAAVVLVTHASHLLNRVDNILLVVDGRNKFYGTWEKLSAFEPVDMETKIAVDHLRSTVQEVSTQKKEGLDEYEPGRCVDRLPGGVKHHTRGSRAASRKRQIPSPGRR